VQEYIQHPPSKPSYVPELMFIDRHRVIRAQYSGADDFFKDQDKNIPCAGRDTAERTGHGQGAGHGARKKPS
jgi:hypothetical protein